MPARRWNRRAGSPVGRCGYDLASPDHQREAVLRTAANPPPGTGSLPGQPLGAGVRPGRLEAWQASHRHELTRSKAIRAICELDAAGTAVTFESVARAAGCPGPGSTPSPTSAPRSSDYATSAAGHPAHRCRHATAAATPPCYADCKPPPPATGNWPRTTSSCATSSPEPSDSSAPPASAPIPGQRPNDQGKAALR